MIAETWNLTRFNTVMGRIRVFPEACTALMGESGVCAVIAETFLVSGSVMVIVLAFLKCGSSCLVLDDLRVATLQVEILLAD
jgi:hypothetical protein